MEHILTLINAAGDIRLIELPSLTMCLYMADIAIEQGIESATCAVKP